MNEQDVLQRVIKVTSQTLGVPPEEVKPEDDFVFDLGAESSQSVELVMGFEQEFDIDMEQEQALQVRTVAEAAEFVGRHLPA